MAGGFTWGKGAKATLGKPGRVKSSGWSEADGTFNACATVVGDTRWKTGRGGEEGEEGKEAALGLMPRSRVMARLALAWAEIRR